MEFALLLGSPLAAALLLACVRQSRWGLRLNVAFSALTLAAAAALAVRLARHGPLLLAHQQLYLDPLNGFLVVLTALVGLTTALFSAPYMRIELAHGRVGERRLRLYHAMYQLFMATMLAALTTNNLGLLWVAMEAATLSTVLLVTLYRTRGSLEAGWKYFILCSVGIAQALFGTILLYLAAGKALGAAGGDALLWTQLYAVRGQLEPAVMALAFVFLLLGYGTKVGLAPLHHWLPDAHAESPAPISAVLSGLLLNVAIYAIVRVKVLAEGSLHSHLPSQMLMGFGLLSTVLASLLLWRQRDIKRLLAYSSIEHMGIAGFAFGMGGPIATFAALLHMTVHALTKSALFFTVGHASQRAGSQLIEHTRGLIRGSPVLGWGLILGSLALLGVPPFGVFASEFLVLTAAVHQQPWAAPILMAALAIAFAAIFSKVQSMVLGVPDEPRLTFAPSIVPTYAHLALVLMLGLAIPLSLAHWYQAAAQLHGSF